MVFQIFFFYTFLTKFCNYSMSELLYNWLNDEVQLCRRVTSFEDDFLNGFLFGELLAKYNQQLNFHQFVDKDDKVSRIKNFTLLYDTFKTLRISFDSNIAMCIINRKPGMAKKVLYELKMQLEKTAGTSFTKSKPSKTLSPLKKIQVSKDQFDKISKQHFNKQLNELHRAQKEIIQEKHLKKFSDFHQKELVKAQIQEQKDSQTRILGRMRFREKQLDNIKKSAEFRNDWEQSNVQKWAVNMTVRKMQREKDTIFKHFQESKKLQTKTLSEMNAIKSLDKDIDEFEKRVLGKEQNSDSDSQNIQKSENRNDLALKKSLSNTSRKQFQQQSRTSKIGNMSMEVFDIKMKKSPQIMESMKHQREKRRRKMIVQQNKRHQMIDVERREKYIIATIQQTSKQEKQIEYEIWRAWQNKEVIIQNKQTIKEKEKQKDETRKINSKFKDDELLKIFRQQHQKELKKAKDRQNKLKIVNTVKDRKQVYNQCRKIIDQFIEMTEECFIHEQETNREELDTTFMNHLFDEFIESARTKEQIAQLELKNYIEGKGEWNIKVTKDSEDQPSDPSEENALPQQVVNNYYLGNILKKVFEEIYHQDPQPDTPKVQSDNLISLLGLEFSGKQLLAEEIKNKYGFNVVKIEQLINRRLKEAFTLQEKGIQQSSQTSELLELCYNGQEIPNHMILSLLKAQVEKNPKSVIVNYPITYSECVQFTKNFGGVEPSDAERKSKLKIKIKDFSRLVRATQSKLVPRMLKPCGLDFALWVDISPSTSLDRFLGRRWIGNECLHLSEEIEKPNELTVGQKASPIILKNDYKLNNRRRLEEWLNLFGIKIQEQDEVYTQNCWEVVNGELSFSQLKNEVFKIFDRSLELKEKKNNEIQREKQKKEKEKQEEISLKKREEELKEKCVLSKEEQITQKMNEALSSIKMDQQFLQGIENLWQNTEKMVISSLTNVFQNIRTQSDEKNKHIAQMKRNYIDLLTRADERFYLVKKFQNEYNKFYDQHPDMVSQEYTKEELHQKIEDLETDLLTIIEEKKDEAIDERSSIMNSGWLENQLEQLMSCIHILLQAQLNRSVASQQIITDFFSKQYMIPGKEIEEWPTDLTIDSTLQIIKEEGYPRLQKLFADVNRLFNREEDSGEDKNKKGGKGAPKKEDKKGGKKKDEVEEKGQATPEEIEMKKALNTEKAIFRYRLKVINQFSLKKIKQINEAGLKMYSDLEEMYQYTDQVEKKSVINTTKIFKQAIQNEQKIENEVQINYVDVIESELIRNFEKPKPVISPASQKQIHDRFTISNLRIFVQLLQNEAEYSAIIKNKRLLTLLNSFTYTAQYQLLLPREWRNISKSQFEHLVMKLDKKKEGEVELWSIFVIVIMANFTLPTTQQLEQYKNNLNNFNPHIKEISRQDFIKVKAWFDQKQPVEQNVRVFDRTTHLKQLLFEVLCGESDSLHIEKYISRLSLQDFGTQELNEKSTYADFAFRL